MMVTNKVDHQKFVNHLFSSALSNALFGKSAENCSGRQVKSGRASTFIYFVFYPTNLKLSDKLPLRLLK